MNPAAAPHRRGLAQRLSEAQATIEALLSGQIDAVVDSKSATPVLLSKAQQALRESEEQYRQIVEATSDGIVKLDVGERIVFVNRRLAEMLGYEPAQMIGMSISAFMGDSAKAILVESLHKRRAGDDTHDIIFCHQNKTEISVNVAATPLFDSERRQIGTLGVVRDVTERKKLQSQLMVSDRMASVGTLAAGVAHEINNPLAAVTGNLDYMAEILGRTGGEPSTSANPDKSDAWLLEEIKGPINDAREAAARVRLIVRDLKIFSRSPIDGPKCRVDVQAVMESSLRMAWNEVRHRARLVKLYGVVPNVEANEGRLGQVFLNLIVNAAQALPEGHAEQNEIRVSTRVHDGRVVIEVSDTGAGIPPEIIGRIFDAFFTTKGVGVGTGLGLAICHRIVTDMDGELTVESAVGKGTTFRVSLPIAGRAAIEEPAPPVEPIAIPGRRGRILVVDDEEIVLRSVQRLLSKEHDVVAVAKAKEALALCAGGETFDVILCDLMMPDMTGMDLHRELSRIAPEEAGRMIFMTGGAFTPKAWNFLADSTREHVEKPFDPKTLRAIVRRHVQRDLQQSVTS
jgi:PAS domain S-box-containing protein